MKKTRIVLESRKDGGMKIYLNCLSHTAIRMLLEALITVLENGRTAEATNEELAKSMHEIILQGLQEVHSDE